MGRRVIWWAELLKVGMLAGLYAVAVPRLMAIGTAPRSEVTPSEDDMSKTARRLPDDLKSAFARWLLTRPQNVQDFAAKNPFLPGDKVMTPEGDTWFMGYGEYEDGRVGLIVTPIDPARDYDAAVAARQQICPEHF